MHTNAIIGRDKIKAEADIGSYLSDFQKCFNSKTSIYHLQKSSATLFTSFTKEANHEPGPVCQMGQ